MDAEAIVESRLSQLAADFVATLPQIGLALAVLAVTWFVSSRSLRACS
jgi:hypothetical protein